MKYCPYCFLHSELSSSHDKETEYENLKAVQVTTLSHSITENKKCVICSENDISKLHQFKILREKKRKTNQLATHIS